MFSVFQTGRMADALQRIVKNFEDSSCGLFYAIVSQWFPIQNQQNHEEHTHDIVFVAIIE
jgi:hypothetical protein